ncbi:hypothetical protein EGI26_09215 [Lacihabitans sp. CCS-44]|uniref:hypothetical protein n=1 Tax=Lacihabitans sp. CCS-44 TaxID=2487331 RepID=UPI0020CEAB85|nr:hypothetical protein [Lacihabitans sp. CCS-44]MCP9755333.1 hypothetical protein [Lacihabitans sp. CCS-44]
MIKKTTFLLIFVFISITAKGSLLSKLNVSKIEKISSDSIKNHRDSLEYLINTNSLDSLEKRAFIDDFYEKPLELFFEQKSIIHAWKACIIDDSLRKVNNVLLKTATFLNRNKSKIQSFKEEFENTVRLQRPTFLLRTWWVDSLKSNFDSLGNSSGFKPLGIDIKEVKKSLLDEMRTEASAPQFVESLINSGNTIPKKIIIGEGYILYKIIPKGNPPPSPFTPFWTKIEDIKKYISESLEQRFGLPTVSHSAKYDVYKIQLKEGKTAIIFESEIAQTIENNYKTSGGGMQSLVLNRAKWTFPVLISELEIFPPFKK